MSPSVTAKILLLNRFNLSQLIAPLLRKRKPSLLRSHPILSLLRSRKRRLKQPGKKMKTTAFLRRTSIASS